MSSPLYLRRRKEKDCSVFEFEDNTGENYVSTKKDPVLISATDFESETLFNGEGFSLTPSIVAVNSVFIASVNASIGPSQVSLTVWRGGLVEYALFILLLEKGDNEIALYSYDAIDQVDFLFEFFTPQVNNTIAIYAGICSGGLLVP